MLANLFVETCVRVTLYVIYVVGCMCIVILRIYDYTRVSLVMIVGRSYDDIICLRIG